jgi:ArsR family transcriptional regulator
LLILRERGMVTAQRDGQSVIYQVADERVIQALDLLRGVLADKLKNQAVLANSVYESLELDVS